MSVARVRAPVAPHVNTRTEDGEGTCVGSLDEAVALEAVGPGRWRTHADPEHESINSMFGGWTKAQKRHFDDGGVFDQIYQPGS